jgi:D-alanyl-D-alanine carboxypeptidase
MKVLIGVEVHAEGVADLGNQRPIGVDDRMRIASAAKAFSGAVALSLVSEGALSLDDTIGEYLSDLPNLPPAWSEVTLAQLLRHKSGLPDFSEEPSFLAALRANPTQAPPPEELLSYAYGHVPPLLFKPGKKYHYSNSDNVAVALMIEAATGESYEDQLQEQVYGLLGLMSTSLPAPSSRNPTYTATTSPKARPKTSASS